MTLLETLQAATTSYRDSRFKVLCEKTVEALRPGAWNSPQGMACGGRTGHHRRYVLKLLQVRTGPVGCEVMYAVDSLNRSHQECEKANNVVTLRLPLRPGQSLTYEEQKRLKLLIHWAFHILDSDNMVEGDDAFIIYTLQPPPINERIPYDV